MYKGKYDKGWDVIRKERFERMLKLGVIPEGTKLTDMPEGVAAWDSLTDDVITSYSIHYTKLYETSFRLNGRCLSSWAYP